MRRYSCCKRSTKASINTSVGLNIRRLPPPGGAHFRLPMTLPPERDRHALNSMRLTITLWWGCSRHKIKAQSLSFDVLCPRGYRLSQLSFCEAVRNNSIFDVKTSILAHHLQAPHQLTCQPFRAQRWRDGSIDGDSDAFLCRHRYPRSRMGGKEYSLV